MDRAKTDTTGMPGEQRKQQGGGASGGVRRWTSRKFLTALGAQIAALLVLLWPGQEEAITEAVRSGVSLLVLGLSALGYISGEASVDRARASGAVRRSGAPGTPGPEP